MRTPSLTTEIRFVMSKKKEDTYGLITCQNLFLNN